eukprot:390399-Rhodomonas_salina.1
MDDIQRLTIEKSCDPSRDCSKSRAQCRHSCVQTMPKVVASVVTGCQYALQGLTSTIFPI